MKREILLVHHSALDEKKKSCLSEILIILLRLITIINIQVTNCIGTITIAYLYIHFRIRGFLVRHLWKINLKCYYSTFRSLYWSLNNLQMAISIFPKPMIMHEW